MGILKKHINFAVSANQGSSRINNRNHEWNPLIEAYEKNYVSIEGDVLPPQIPRVLHLIWLGGPIPESYVRLGERWKSVLVGWEVKWWTDVEVDQFEFPSKDVYNNVKNFGAKSDILRYEILYAQGGVYVDTDFLAVKTLDDLLYLDLFSGTGHVGRPHVFNSIIGSKPGNKVFEMVLHKVRTSFLDESTPDAILMSTGPGMFTNILLPELAHQRAVIFPTTFFYPFPAIRRAKIRNLDVQQTEREMKEYIRPETYCVHLWYTSWQ
jgi:inositol phosphorylceramide mannosyltransferase catalytic subunit